MPSRAGHLTVASRAVAFLCTIPLIIIIIIIIIIIMIIIIIIIIIIIRIERNNLRTFCTPAIIYNISETIS